jgi:DNA-binding HxlR family transcriptional regulator
MTAVKESSTNQQNKQIVQNTCPVTFTLEKIGGRWKPLILFSLRNGALRYGQLKKSIPAITEKMLVQHLRELEADKLVNRDVKPVVPPHVEYSLTESGQTLGPILGAMAQWGLEQTGRLSQS